MEVYLDNCATTAPCEAAVRAAEHAMRDLWGNPSSLHAAGRRAEDALTQARRDVAGRFACETDEVYFTSGGTEGNNLLINGAVKALGRRGRRIVTTAIEHASVHEPIKRLESEGYEVIRLPADKTGRIDEQALRDAVDASTILISIMAVNNEVGTVQPVKAAKKAVVAAGAPALVHCDAVQAFGKLYVTPKAYGIDLMTVSSHKIHGPKGAGAVYVKKGVRIVPPFNGGEQEGRVRPGTQPTPAIAGFAAAVNALPDTDDSLKAAKALKDYLLQGLADLGEIVVNSPPNALPHIVNLSVLGVLSEHMLNFLSERGIFVSSGSACAKGRQSRVLTAMGLDDALIKSALRVSFSRDTTTDDIDALLTGLDDARRRFMK